jgi:hypothetical protein
MSAEIVALARAAILDADPGLTETVKWNAPNFVHDGVDRVTMRLPPKGGLQLIFHRGAAVRADSAAFVFPDPTGWLAWPAPDRGVLTLADADEVRVRSADITDLVRRWIAA